MIASLNNARLVPRSRASIFRGSGMRRYSLGDSRCLSPGLGAGTFESTVRCDACGSKDDPSTVEVEPSVWCDDLAG